MIDFDREEFLERLDFRISVISCLLSTHEKYLCRDLPRKSFEEMIKSIDEAHKYLLRHLHDFDDKICDHFRYLREKLLKKENK